MAQRFGDYLKQLLNEKQWRASTLAKSAGLSHVYVGAILNSEDPKTGKPPNITLNTLSAIASALDVPRERLLKAYFSEDDYDKDCNSPSEMKLSPLEGLYRIPLRGNVSAGALTYEEEPQETLYYDWYDIKEFSNDLFCLKVCGNSMFPPVEDGAILLIRPARQLRNKARYVIQTEEGETTFKLIEFHEDGARLVPLNPDYPPIPIHKINISKLFEVLGYKVDWT